jgi:hypothetical protein
MPNHMQYNTIRVHMSGNSNYPKVTITREDRFPREKRYWISSEYDMKRIQLLFERHSHLGGSIYVDLENSAIECTFEKFIIEE